MELNKVKTALLAMQRHSWEQGVAMQAFFELGDTDIATAMAIEAAYRAADDGRVGMIATAEAVTDPCSAGEVLQFAAKKTNSRKLQSAYDKLLKWALTDAPRSDSGILYHINTRKQIWVDSMYMLPPFLAAAGHYTEAVAQINGYWNTLYNAQKHLLSHMWDDEKKDFARADFWGVGNGWAMAGLCRVIDLLPQSMSGERERLIGMNRELITSVCAQIREDGLSHDVLDKPDTFVEVNLPQMLAYSIYRGIHSGWLDVSFKAQADKCRLAACAKVDEFGFVRDVCGAPSFDKPGVAPEGQAFFLLVHAAYERLMQNK